MMSNTRANKQRLDPSPLLTAKEAATRLKLASPGWPRRACGNAYPPASNTDASLATPRTCPHAHRSGRSKGRRVMSMPVITSLHPRVLSWALQPAPYARAVAAVDIAEFALEIGFLAGHDAVAD